MLELMPKFLEDKRIDILTMAFIIIQKLRTVGGPRPRPTWPMPKNGPGLSTGMDLEGLGGGSPLHREDFVQFLHTNNFLFSQNMKKLKKNSNFRRTDFIFPTIFSSGPQQKRPESTPG